jgi:hypothetical protein
MMKRIIAAVCVAGGASSAAALPPPRVLADGGHSAYRIVIPRGAIPSERHAAEELARFLKEMSGAELPVVDDASPASAKEILLGDNARLKALQPAIDWKTTGTDGFTIRTAGPKLVIAGGRPRGTLHGVYAFLEETLGCRWYSPDVSRIPRLPRVEVPDLDVTQVPAFESRDLMIFTAFDGDWAARNRLNGHHAKRKDIHGGRVAFQPFVHSFDTIVPPKTYFGDHPEYFGEENGNRVARNQPCLTNPDVLKLAITKAGEWMAKEGVAVVSISQNDWGEPCRCKPCRAAEKREESPMGSLLPFVNAVADEAARRRPDVAIETLAYVFSRRPPKTERPRKNVIIRLCDIECCFAHPLETCDGAENRRFVEDLRAWTSIHDRVYIWDYVTNFHHYLAPHPNFDAMAANLRLFARSGVKGVVEQGNYQSRGEFSELRAWLLAKLLWNPETDAAALTDEFLAGYYGKAAPAIRDYLDFLHARVRERNLHFGKSPKLKSAHLALEAMLEADARLEEAERLAEDEAVRTRVRMARAPVWHVLAEELPEGDGRRTAFQDRFVEAARAGGVTHTREGSGNFRGK